MKKILITGANGVLAGKVLERLMQNKNIAVCAATRDKESFEKQCPDIVCVGYEDIFRTDFLKDIDLVLNCAFPRQFDMDILGKALGWYDALLSKAAEMNVQGLVNISSQSVYGNYREDFVDESGAIMPQDSYALTKYAGELLGHRASSAGNMRVTNLRLASLIGTEYPERVVNKIIVNAFNQPNISINNDKNVFGYMDIDDAAEGIAVFMEKTSAAEWERIYNVGIVSENFKNFAWTAECIASLFEDKGMKKNLEIQKKDKADKLCLMSSEKFYGITEWKPKTSLEETVGKIFSHCFALVCTKA